MWKRVVHSIHEEDQVLLPKNFDSSLPGPWRDIKRTALADQATAKAFFDNLAVKVGNGRRVRFWLEVWANKKPLKEVFPALFRLSSQQDETISNMGWFEGNLWRWILAWKQAPATDEQRQILQLQTMLQQYPLVQNGTDQLLWCGKPLFSTKSLVTEAMRISLSNVTVDNLVSTVWKNIAPPKVEFMVWLALLGKLHTKELLLRKGLRNFDNVLCCFCSTHIETGDHLLVSCQISWHIWSMIAADLGLRLETQQSLRQLYEWWMARHSPNKLRKKLTTVSFFAVTWSLWHQRNMMIFQNQDFDQATLYHTIKWRIALWSKAWRDTNPYSTEELVRQFSSIPILFP